MSNTYRCTIRTPHSGPRTFKSKFKLKRHIAAYKAALTRKKNPKQKTMKSSNPKKSRSKGGKKAWKYSITPSHDFCGKMLEKKHSGKIATGPTGQPDFVVHDNNVKFYELKRVQGTDDSKYLNDNQRKTIIRLLRKKISVSIIYYKKIGKGLQSKDYLWKKIPLNATNIDLYHKNSKNRIDTMKIKFPT